jgi:hypothetical protein
MRQWNQFKLLGDGDFLRNYAREHNLFIYPYDLLTGSDIALFEDLDARRNDERYLICALSEVAPGSDKGGKLYKLAPQAIYKHATACRGATYEAALAFWNERMQKLARTLLQPLPRRFLSLEGGAIFINILGWGLFVLVLGFIPFVYEFLKENALVIIFMLVCCNLEHLFMKSYGEEIPGRTLELWAQSAQGKFSEGLYGQMMGDWEELKERHAKALPYYLLWKRGQLRNAADAEVAAEPESEAGQAEPDYRAYCREIKAKLAAQIKEIAEQGTKISDRSVKRYVEDIVKILREIQCAISVEAAEAQAIGARKVVAYWNEETLSLLENYLLLSGNSSQEAQDTQSSIAALLHDMAPVYRKELSRITASRTLELKASMSVLQKEIEETLHRGR